MLAGHHPYVNIRGRDPDLNHHSPLHRYAPWHRFKRLHAYQMYTLWFIWAIGSSVQAHLTDIICIRKNTYQHVVAMPRWSTWRRAVHYAGRALTVVLVFVWPFFVFGFAKAVLFAVVPSVIFSAFYMSISQVQVTQMTRVIDIEYNTRTHVHTHTHAHTRRRTLTQHDATHEYTHVHLHFSAFALKGSHDYSFYLCLYEFVQVGHITNETLAQPNKDFYAHQIEHTHNYGTDSPLCFYMSGGLNLQVKLECN